MPGTEDYQVVISKRAACAAGLSVLAICLLPFAVSVHGQGTGQCTIRGTVSGPDGRPVEVLVNLREITRTVVGTALSDSNGGFYFGNVADGRYYVTVENNEYQHAVVDTHVAWGLNSAMTVSINLAALPNASKIPLEEIQKGSQPVSIVELRAKFPKKAVKEYEKGNTQVAHGDFEAAIESYEKAVHLAPGMYPALNNLGNAYLELKRLPQAEEAFRRALAADPTGAEPCINLGHVFYESRKYAEAEKYLLQGLRLFPSSALGYMFLGLTYAHTGKLPEAETNLQKAVSQNDPKVAAARLELANLYLRENRRDKARNQLEAYLAARPQDPQADRIRQTLARLKQPPDIAQ